MLKSLFYCHNVIKVIHKDIKPDNIVINNSNQAVLIDFGVSLQFEDQDIDDNQFAGSLYYQAPELFLKSGI
jgi:serine/threonine protein kinase